MIILDLRETSSPTTKPIREFSNLSEALYHAEVGEVIWLVDKKSNKRERVERTSTGWLYEVMN